MSSSLTAFVTTSILQIDCAFLTDARRRRSFVLAAVRRLRARGPRLPAAARCRMARASAVSACERGRSSRCRCSSERQGSSRRASLAVGRGATAPAASAAPAAVPWAHRPRCSGARPWAAALAAAARRCAPAALPAACRSVFAHLGA